MPLDIASRLQASDRMWTSSDPCPTWRRFRFMFFACTENDEGGQGTGAVITPVLGTLNEWLMASAQAHKKSRRCFRSVRAEGCERKRAYKGWDFKLGIVRLDSGIRRLVNK